MKRYIALAGLIIFSKVIIAQDFNFSWAHTAFDSILPNGVLIDTITTKSDPMHETSTGVVIDQYGNTISTGWAMGSIYEIGNGIHEVYKSKGTATFIQKRNSNGDLVWANYFEDKNGQTSSGHRHFNDIVLDGEDNIYVCGNVNDSTDFDPGVGESWAYPTNSPITGFVAKYTSNGDLVFVYFLKQDSNCEIRSLALDHEGNILAGGVFAGTLDFDAGIGISSSTSNGKDDNFVIKINTSGEYVWHKTWGNSGEDDVVKLTADNKGNVFIGGLFQDTLDFDPGPSVHNENSSGTTNGFILSLDLNGDFNWVYPIKSSSYISFGDIASNGKEVAAVVSYSSEITVDPQGGWDHIDPTPQQNVAVININAQGKYNWHYIPDVLTWQAFTSGYEIASYSKEWYLGMHTTQSTFIDFSNAGTDTLTTPNTSVVIVQLDNNGAYQRNKLLRLEKNAKLQLNGLAVNQYGIAASGAYDDAYLDADPNPSEEHLLLEDHSYNHYAIFLKSCRSYANSKVTVCSSYTSPSGKYTWDKDGRYRDTISNQYGCDSVLSIKVNIDTINKIVEPYQGGIKAQADSLTYQWLDCNSNYQGIAGQTKQTFTPTSNGYYAVRLTKNGCIDTSECYNFMLTSEQELFPIKMNVYPNPNNGEFSLTINSQERSLTIEIVNILGERILTKQIASNLSQNLQIDVNNGIYYLIASNGERSLIQKVIVRK